MIHRENRLRRHVILSGSEGYTGAIRFWVNSRREAIRLWKSLAGYSAALHAVYYVAIRLLESQ
jgi:hypothetical protein